MEARGTFHTVDRRSRGHVAGTRARDRAEAGALLPPGPAGTVTGYARRDSDFREEPP